MFVYNFLLFSQHDFDSIMFRIQLLVVQKYNQNVMKRSFPLNLKQTYQPSLFAQVLSSSPKLVQSKIFFKLLL